MNRLTYFLFAILLGCGQKEDPMGENQCPATETKILNYLWITPQSSYLQLPSQGFILGDDLIYAYTSLASSNVSAFDPNTGKERWTSSFPPLNADEIKLEGNKLYYVEQGPNILHCFDPVTQSNTVAFLAAPKTLLDHKFAIMGNLVANLTLEFNPNASYLTSRVFVTDLVKGSSQKVFETNQPMIVSAYGNYFPLIDFAIGPTGDTILCLIKNTGTSISVNETFYEYHSINLNTGKLTSSPVPFSSDLLGEGRIAVDPDNGRIYLINFQAGISCLNAADGNTIWSSTLSNSINYKLSLAGQNLLVVGIYTCFALDPITGHNRWQLQLNQDEFTQHVENLATDQTCIYLVAGAGVLKIDQSSGCLLGRYPNLLGSEEFVRQAVMDTKGGKIYLSTRYRFVAFKKP